MNSFLTQLRSVENSDSPDYRWRRILNLPAEVFLKDLSTGKRYQAGNLVPIYNDKHLGAVFYFRAVGTDPQDTSNLISVSMLRLLEDGARCSIGGLSR